MRFISPRETSNISDLSSRGSVEISKHSTIRHDSKLCEATLGTRSIAVYTIRDHRLGNTFLSETACRTHQGVREQCVPPSPPPRLCDLTCFDSSIACPSHIIALEDAVLDVHVYQTNEMDVFEEFTNGTRGEGDEVMAASVCELPSQALEGVWDRYV